MTAQLISEQECKNKFLSFCAENGIEIISEVFPHQNKRDRIDSDYIVAIDGKPKTVSLKTKGGAFTTKNLGTGVTALKKWYKGDKFLSKVKAACQESLERRHELGKIHARWEDFGDEIADKKLYVIEPILLAYEELFSVESNIAAFMHYIYEGKSDILWIDGEYIEGVELPNLPKSVERINSKSLKLGNLVLRFKTEGGKVSSSIKINVE